MTTPKKQLKKEKETGTPFRAMDILIQHADERDVENWKRRDKTLLEDFKNMTQKEISWEERVDKKVKELVAFIGDELSQARREALEEERQFILNVLDGIDRADEQMGNKGGGTKAIRLALKSRSLT